MKVLHLTWKETMLPKLAANEASAKGAKLAFSKEKEKNRRCYRTMRNPCSFDLQPP